MKGAFRTFVLLAIVAGSVAPGGAGASVSVGRQVAVEARLLEAVNARRAEHGAAPYLLHAGLRDQARSHSADMSARRRLTHDGFVERLERAAPDPFERNGPSDDGIWPHVAGCENVAYRFRAGRTDETDVAVAQGIFEQWWGSPPHRDCLLDVWGWGLNAAGIGLHRDAGGVWWATLEVARDGTSPAPLAGCALDAPPVSVNRC